MAHFNVCPEYGSHLDPGERCDCTEDKPSVPAMQRAVAQTARIIPSERAHYAPGRAWIGKPGPKAIAQ